ncbi:MAG: hypothetical protein ACTSRG_24660 [Candidatus Helarchaeota archaeon]
MRSFRLNKEIYLEKKEIFLPISRSHIQKVLKILQKDGEKFTFLDIFRYLGFSTDILEYKTEISILELRKLQKLMISTEEDYTKDFFKLIDEQKSKEEEEKREIEIKKRREENEYREKIIEEILEEIQKSKEVEKYKENSLRNILNDYLTDDS